MSAPGRLRGRVREVLAWVRFAWRLLTDSDPEGGRRA